MAAFSKRLTYSGKVYTFVDTFSSRALASGEGKSLEERGAKVIVLSRGGKFGVYALIPRKNPPSPERRRVKKNPGGRWYFGYLKDRSGIEVFWSQRKPTESSHGRVYGAVTGPYKTKEEAEQRAHYVYAGKVSRATKKNPPLMMIGNPRTKDTPEWEVLSWHRTKAGAMREFHRIKQLKAHSKIMIQLNTFTEGFDPPDKWMVIAQPLLKTNPPLMVIGNPKIGLSKLKKGSILEFHMTNLPGNPWYEYYVLAKDRNDITFSSIPPSRLQYQAEHFRLTPLEFSRGLNDGSIRFPSHEGKIKMNPSGDLMSDSVHEVRYTHRGDGQSYKHSFKRGVRMVANEDGTITMYHPTKRIHEEFPE